MIQVQARIEINKEGLMHMAFDLLSREDTNEAEREMAKVVEESMKTVITIMSLGTAEIEEVKEATNAD